MMETRVQYAKTSDGVDIAFAVYGDGPALIIPPNLVTSHLQLEMEAEFKRAFVARLARRLTVVRYDCRGIGMSQRDHIDFSVDAAQRDLAAVIDKLGLQRVALYTHTLAGAGPMAFAAGHSERLTSLVCWVAQTARVMPEFMRQLEQIEPLQHKDWDLFCKIASRIMFGWDAPDATQWAAMARAGSSPKSRFPSMQAARESYRGGWARDVRVPALILYLATDERSMGLVRTLASTIPNAHVLAIPGNPPGIPPAMSYDSEILTTAIADFVEAAAEGAERVVRTPELQLGAMRAILWTDIEDHTSLMQRLGDVKGRDLLREHEMMTRDALSANGGTEVKAMGDGFMAWFSSAQQALACAVALQRAFAARNAAATEPMRIRAAINAGEPIVEDDDLFGASVITAARICREAKGSEIIASDVVRQLVTGKGFAFADRGAVVLKGFEDPIRIYEVRWQD